MGVKILKITLHNAEGLYKPGDWVNGHVDLELDKPTKARGKWLMSFILAQFIRTGPVYCDE